MEIFGVEEDVINSKDRRKVQVAARSLLCYWAVRELGLTATELAKRLRDDATRSELCFSRGEQIAQKNNYTLVV